MRATLSWTNKAARLECRVCGFVGKGNHVATIDRPSQGDLLCVRCPSCESIAIQGELHPHYADSDSEIDQAIESGISIEASLEVISSIDTRNVRSFLDVGCNFGYGVDLAERIFGWHSRGIEPTLAGRRGAEALGVHIDDAELAGDSNLGEQFDLILASEVLEHVPDPIDFLKGIRNHLSSTGRALLTTPSAEAVTFGHDERDVLLAVSPGFHQFLPSPAGLEILLRKAGFESVTVLARGDNLRAIASPRAESLIFISPDPHHRELESYYRDRSAAPTPDSALAIGMASRYFRSLVNRGAFVEAQAAGDLAVALIEDRYGVDASDPQGAMEQLATGRASTGSLVPVAYCFGMIALLHGRDPARAVEYFLLAEAAALARTGVGATMDGDSADLMLNARRYRALALAELGDSSVHELLADIGDDVTQVKTFVAAVNAAHLELAQELRADAARVTPAMTKTRTTIDAGFDGLLCLAMLDLQSGSPRGAKSWLSLAQSRLDAHSDHLPTSSRAAEIAENIATQRAVAEQQIAEELPVAEEPDVPLTPEVPDAVSVIMPVYNGEAHIREAIQSVIDQSLQPFELIVIDDGSVDDSIRILQSLATPFPVRIITQPNAGQSAARNKGGRLATGEYLAFIDQDDRWRHDHLERLHEEISGDRNLGWVFSDFDQVDGQGRTITTHFIAETGVQHPKRSLIGAIAGDLMALPSASILRRAAVFEVNGFDPALTGYEDDDLFVRMFRAGFRHSFLPASTVRYRVHPAGSSASPVFLRSRLRFMKKLLTTIPDDHRLNHFFSQDVVVPRFLHATLSDYASALASKDFVAAARIAHALRAISTMQGEDHLKRRMQLAALDHPRRMRAMLLVLERLPRWMRPHIPESLFFGNRSIVRASRFHPALPSEVQ